MDEDTSTTTTDSTQPAKQKQLSVEIAKLFSYKQDDKSLLKLSLWNGKLGLDFSKNDANGVKRSFITFDYEKLIFINSLIREIGRERIEAYRNGKPYAAYDIPIECSFPDKDHPGELRKYGTFVIKTVSVKSDDGVTANRIVLGYESGTETFYVTLCSRILTKQIASRAYVNKVDPNDSRFYYFAYTINSIVEHFPIIAYMSSLVELQFSKPKQSSFNNGSSNRDPTTHTRQSISNDDDVAKIPF
jgi:hypothetical protein